MSVELINITRGLFLLRKAIHRKGNFSNKTAPRHCLSLFCSKEFCGKLKQKLKFEAPKIPCYTKYKHNKNTNLVVLLEFVDQRSDLLQVGARQRRDFAVRLSALFQFIFLKILKKKNILFQKQNQ